MRSFAFPVRKLRDTPRGAATGGITVLLAEAPPQGRRSQAIFFHPLLAIDAFVVRGVTFLPDSGFFGCSRIARCCRISALSNNSKAISGILVIPRRFAYRIYLVGPAAVAAGLSNR